MLGFKKYKYGLVLSGGAARGFAHVGVLKALHELKINPQVVSGTSVGAIVGAFYADGYTPEEMIDLFVKKKLLNLFSVTLPKKGLLKVSGLLTLLKDNLRAKSFEDLKLPFYVAACNYHTGEVHYFNKGVLIEKIIASSSIPVIFTPVNINGQFFIDGGIVNNMPIEPIHNKCKRIIGSHVNPTGYTDKCNNLIDIAERSFHLSAVKEIKRKEKLFDVYIEPEELKNYNLLDISKGKELYEIGYNETMKKLKSISKRKLK